MANNNSSHSHSHVTIREAFVQYTSCQRNHSAPHGPQCLCVLDGCGWFEPSGPPGSPEAMSCAACNCHRNFHKRVIVDLPHCQRTEMTPSPPQPPPPSPTQPDSEPGPSIRQRLTREQFERLQAIAKRNNWRCMAGWLQGDTTN